MAIPRSKVAHSTVAQMYIDILTEYGFEISSSLGRGVRMKKKYFDGYAGTLIADINDYGANGYINVEFDGISINKPRRMDYNDNDMKKFVARIKRVLKGAEVEADRITSRNSAKEKFANDLGIKLHGCLRHVEFFVHPFTTTEARVEVNGYSLYTNADLETRFNAFGVNQTIPVEMAASFAEGLPTNVEDDE